MLSEAVQREPASPHSVKSRYMVAQSKLQLARYAKKELQSTLIESTREALRADGERQLTEGAEALAALKTELIEKQEKEPLTPVEQRILRNCFFAQADALFDLQQYENAIQAYASATNRYQHEPESLEAYVQIANCHRKMSRPVDSRRTLEQAKLILNRIRPDADFQATTRYSRQEWSELLNWLTSL
ncbi:MAG: tol-pal system YbgF family protein [Pirellulaceae bacterium]